MTTKVSLTVKIDSGVETYMASWCPTGDTVDEKDVSFNSKNIGALGNLSAGDYDIFWGLFGTPGSSITLTLSGDDGSQIATFDDQIQAGKSTRSNGAFFTMAADVGGEK